MAARLSCLLLLAVLCGDGVRAAGLRLTRREVPAVMTKEIVDLKKQVAAQANDLHMLAGLMGRKMDQLESTLVVVAGDLKNVRSSSQKAAQVCGALSSCGECAGAPTCGWCSTEQSCVPGDRMGPLHGKCRFYDFNTCSSLACASYPECGSCTADAGCGWCASDGSCKQGNEFGPSFSATCGKTAGKSSWQHLHGAAQCAVSVTAELPLSTAAQNTGMQAAAASAVEEASLQKKLAQVDARLQARLLGMTTTMAPTTIAATTPLPTTAPTVAVNASTPSAPSAAPSAAPSGGNVTKKA